MRRLGGALLLTVALCVAQSGAPRALVAQQQPSAAPSDSLFAALFTPELIMQHRRDINLTDGQRDQITKLIQELQADVVKLQLDLVDETEELRRILAAPRVDQDRSREQMDRVLDREASIKRAHLVMLVRIKNLLRPEQQAALRRLREEAGGA